ncbi:MAG: hydroxysqualene dehydroxylase HpnE, partial [Ignavibacteriaceae bacterium]
MKLKPGTGKPGKVIILGGGFAGLTAAAYLVKSGFKVEVIESSGKVGGRAYSIVDKDTNSVIDNGQHILMGCYRETLDFLKLIGAENNFIFQDKLKVNFVKEDFHTYPLKAVTSFYPFNLLFGLLNYQAISFNDRLLLLKVFLKLNLYSSRDLEKKSIVEWLDEENQTEGIKKAFWEILAVGALNTNITKASAKIFVDILKQIFLKGNKAATIVLPAGGLSESYCNNAERYISQNGGEIKYSETVQALRTNGMKIISVTTSQREIKDFDYVVSALPLYAVNKILPESHTIILPSLEYSSILSVHIWLKENRLKENFYGFINSPVQWVFNHGNHITIVISDADYLMDKSKEDIFDIVSAETYKYLKIPCDDILSYKVIKEKRATFIPSNKILHNRPSTETPYRNFFLAGDWV